MATNNSINSPLPTTVPNGGTGDVSFTAYSVLCGGTTSTGVLQNVSGVGTSGQVLKSNGASALPTWQAGPVASLSITAASSNIVCSPSTITGTGTIDLASSPSVSGSWTVGTSFNVPDTTSSTVGIIFHNSNPFIHTGKTDANNNIFVGICTGGQIGNFTLTGTANLAICGGAVSVSNASFSALTTGSRNLGIGYNSTTNLTSGSDNISIAGGTLVFLTTGNNNISIGDDAGGSYTGSESNNIQILYGVLGPSFAGESNVLRIAGNGTGTGAGQINTAIICGITGKTSASGIGVLINTSSVLGTTTSSRRFKHNIEDMGDSSDRLMKLRPVTFLYNKEIEDATDEMKFGLIAEEVAEIMPELVVLDEEDKPFTIRYNDMPAILLNEIQKLNKVMDNLEARRGTIH